MFRFPRAEPRRPLLRPGLLRLGLLLALGGGAHAQTAPPPPECAAAPELLEVFVGSESRGSFIVRRTGAGGWLVEAAALRESERGYIGREVRCPDGDLVELRADLSVTYDGTEQRLGIAPARALLASGEVDAGGRGDAAPTPTQPLVSLGTVVDVKANWRTGAVTSDVVLEGGYARGAWEARAAVGTHGEGTDFGVRGRVGVAWQLNERWTVRAGWNTALPEASGALVTSDFKGVQVEGRSGEAALLPPLDLDLPLTSRVTVFLNDTILTAFEANPGRVTIRNLPRLQPFGVLNIFIDDAAGRRVVNVPFGSGPGRGQAGEFQVSARAGVEDGRPGASFLGTVAVTPDWTLTASGEGQAGGDLALRVSGATTAWGGALGVGASVARPGAGTGTGARAWDGAFEVSYARSFGAWYVGGGLGLPLSDPLRPRLNLNALYFTPAWSLGTTVVYDAREGVAGSLSVSAPVTRTVSLGGRVGYDSGRWRVGANVGWTPTPRLGVSASAGLGTGEGAGLGAGVRYELAPGQVAWARASGEEVSLGYSLDAPVLVEVAGSTGGTVAARVSGSVLLAGGARLVVPGAATRGVLIRTGVPGLILRTNAGTVRTNAAGDAVAFSGSGDRSVNVSVDVEALPFTVTVGEDATTLDLAGNGLAVLDWRGNFRVSRWLRVFWAPGEAAGGAVLVVGGRTWKADRDGWVLLDALPGTPQGELRDPGGARTCPLRVPTEGESATCEASQTSPDPAPASPAPASPTPASPAPPTPPAPPPPS